MKLYQAWNYTEATETTDCIALVALKNVPIDILIFLWKCPLLRKSGLAPTWMKFQAWVFHMDQNRSASQYICLGIKCSIAKQIGITILLCKANLEKQIVNFN